MSTVEPNPMTAESTSSESEPTETRTQGIGESTRAVHAGEARQKPGDSITDPIFCASTYTFTDSQSIINFIESGETREEYGRYGIRLSERSKPSWRRWNMARRLRCFPAGWRLSSDC